MQHHIIINKRVVFLFLFFLSVLVCAWVVSVCRMGLGKKNFPMQSQHFHCSFFNNTHIIYCRNYTYNTSYTVTVYLKHNFFDVHSVIFYISHFCLYKIYPQHTKCSMLELLPEWDRKMFFSFHIVCWCIWVCVVCFCVW